MIVVSKVSTTMVGDAANKNRHANLPQVVMTVELTIKVAKHKACRFQYPPRQVL